MHTESVLSREGSSGSRPALCVRPYDAAKNDEKGILEVFEIVFGKRRTLEHWKWKFQNNPYHPPLVSVATDPASQQIVGHYAVMPVAINVMGKPYAACQSLDTLVHPNFRMRGIFESTASDCYSRCEAAKLSLVYGFPGPLSYPGFMRKLNWKRVTTLDGYQARLSIEPELKRILKLDFLVRLLGSAYRIGFQFIHELRAALAKAKLLEAVTYEESKTLPDGYDSFWNSIKDYEVYSIWKDAKYMTWRYDQNPDHQFTYHVLRSEGAIVALSISTVSAEKVFLCEWMISSKKRVVSDYLLERVLVHASHQKGRRVSFQGADSGFFREAFRSLKREYQPECIFGLLAFSRGKDFPSMELPVNWTVTLGDSDVI